MDIKIITDEGKFKLRVSAIIENDDEILVLNDERGAYDYLPGGHIQLYEDAKSAILREIKEELGVDLEIVRALWLNQSFFIEDVSHKKYHEICIYYLLDGSKSELLDKGKQFIVHEGKHTFCFKWVKKSLLKDMYFYPTFLKDNIMKYPETLQMNIEYE